MRRAAGTGLALFLLASAHPPPAFSAGRVPELSLGAGLHDFDSRTGYRDGLVVGIGLARPLHPRLDAVLEFSEVYTRREPTAELARQVRFAGQFRLEPLGTRFSPSFPLGIALVHYDGSQSKDSYGAALELGAGARWRLGSTWALRGTWSLRSQRVRLHRELEGGGYSPRAELSRLWERQFRLSVARALDGGGGALLTLPIDAGLVGGWLATDGRMRFEPAAIAGAYARARALPWLGLGMELAGASPRDKRTGRTEGVVFASVGARIHPLPRGSWSPFLAGSATFMSFHLDAPESVVSEGFDLGVGLRWLSPGGWVLDPTLSWRLQGFRLGEGGEGGGESGYLGSAYFRIGVGRAI